MDSETVRLLNRLESCSHELERLMLELDEVRAQRDHALGSAGQLQSELYQLALVVSEQSEERERARAHIDLINAKYRSVVSSSSWRMTAPLRRFRQSTLRRG
jgi:hypothetical protein